MARVRFYRPIFDRAGQIVTDAVLRILNTDTLQLLEQPLYTSRSGPETVPNPHMSKTGHLDFYLDHPQTIAIGIKRPGTPEELFRDIPIGGTTGPPGPPGPPGPGTVPFEYQMPVAQTTATISHNLGRDPVAIQVLEPGGDYLTGYDITVLVPGEQIRLGFDISVAALIRLM